MGNWEIREIGKIGKIGRFGTVGVAVDQRFGRLGKIVICGKNEGPFWYAGGNGSLEDFGD